MVYYQYVFLNFEIHVYKYGPHHATLHSADSAKVLLLAVLHSMDTVEEGDEITVAR